LKRPLLFLAVYLGSGIFCAHLLSLPYSGVLWPLGFLGLILIPFLNRTKIFLLYTLFFYLGFLLYQYHVFFPPSDRIDRIRGLKREIGLRGKIIDFVEILGVSHCILKTSQVKNDKENWLPCRGNALIRLSSEAEFRNELYDRVEINADVLNLPLKNRDMNKSFYTWYLAHEISLVASTYPVRIKIWNDKPFLKRMLISFKNYCASNLEKGLPSDAETRPLLKAMLLGERAGFPPSLKHAFLCTNTIHILSISGLHLTIILMAMLLVFGLLPLSRNWVRFMGLLGIWLYAVMTVLQPPILRSAIMASFFLAGAMLRKKVDLVNILGASALGILLFRPLQLFDPGFQLSYLCLVALIFLSPAFEKDLSFLKGPDEEWHIQRDWKHRMAIFLRKNMILLLSGSAAVWIGVLPLITYHFRMVSPITVLANVLAVPLVGLIMNIGFASSVLGGIDWIAIPLNTVNHFLTELLTFILRLFSKLPGAYFYVEKPTVLWIMMFYAIVLVGLIRSKIKGKFAYYAASAVFLVVLLGNFHLKEILKLSLYETDQYFMELIEWPDRHRDLRIKQLNSSEGKKVREEKTTLGWRLPQVFKVRKIDRVVLETEDSVLAGVLSNVFPDIQFKKPGEAREQKEDYSSQDSGKVLFKDVVIRPWDFSQNYVDPAEKERLNIFVLSKKLHYGHSDLKILDQIPKSLVVLGSNVNKKISDDMNLKKIECLNVKKGKRLRLETDGQKIWTIED